MSSAAARPILSIQGVSKAFGGIQAVQGCSFDVAPGLITGLIGPNGAGKTTVFNLITGFLRADTGSIRYKGEEIAGLPPYRVEARGVVRTFQHLRLWAKMSVLENVLVGMHCRTRAGPGSILLAFPGARAERSRAIERARELLAFFGERLLPRAHDPAASLSYANRRRLEIARALATQPELLLLDEPAAGMNPTEKRELREDIARIRDRGVTVLLIEHDMALVQGICERVAVLDHGVKIADGSFQEARRNPAVLEAYLGRRHA